RERDKPRQGAVATMTARRRSFQRLVRPFDKSLVDANNDFASCMSLFQILQRRWYLTQVVSAVDHRGYLSRLQKICQNGQVPLVQFGYKRDEFLAAEP